jgi:hypothetical protein
VHGFGVEDVSVTGGGTGIVTIIQLTNKTYEIQVAPFANNSV